MGVGEFWSDLFRTKKGYSDLIGINRAFFMQGLLLVSVCRRLPDPDPGQVDAFKRVCDAIMAALKEGAKKDLEKIAEQKSKAVKKFEHAKKLLCSYLDGNSVSLNPIRGIINQAYDGKRLRDEMVDAMKNDKAAIDALEKLNAGFSAKMEEIKKLRKIGISVTYFPDLGLPDWDPTHRQSPFIISKEYTAPIYYAKNIFEVEEHTTIELFLHRLLQYKTHDRNLKLLSLERRPELYKRYPDDKYPETSLLPLSTVDEYKEKDKALILTIETELNKTINVFKGGKISLPSEWRNIWIIRQNEWVLVRKGDIDFTLHKYTMADFLAELKYQPTSHPQYGLSYEHTKPQMAFQQPYNGVPAPPMAFSPTQMPEPQLEPPIGQRPPTMSAGPAQQHVVAPSVGQPPPTTSAGPAGPSHRAPPPPHAVAPSVGQRPPTTSAGPTPPPQRAAPSQLPPGPTPPQSANTSKSSLAYKRDTGPTRVNSAEKAKMSIPDSSSANHHVAGDMRLVGREKKPAQPSSGGFFSRIFKWS